MSITVKLYGELREKISLEKEHNGRPQTVEIEFNNSRTVFDMLKKFNINEDEISHIFVNGIMCGPGTKINDKDRIGIFPRRMGIIFLELLPQYR